MRYRKAVCDIARCLMRGGVEEGKVREQLMCQAEDALRSALGDSGQAALVAAWLTE